MGYDWEKHELSYVLAPEEACALLAIRPNRLEVRGGDPGEEIVIWYDSDHQRAFELDTVKVDEPDRFVFVSRGMEFVLQPMTLAAYRRDVKKKLAGGRSFKTEDELRQFFLVRIFKWE